MHYVETHFTEHNSKIASAVRRAPGSLAAGLGARLVGAWRAHRRRAQQRAQIQRLSERDLRDIGLTRAQLDFELESPLARALRRFG